MALKEDTPASSTFSFAAGHSLGEYNALLAADAFNFTAGLELVVRRGRLMAEARTGGMLAVLDESEAALQQRFDALGLRSMVVANHNSPRQLVASGSKDEVAALAHSLFGDNIRHVVLDVSGAFHSGLMLPAQAAFEQAFTAIALRDPSFPVIANVTGTPYRAGELPSLLIRQISSPVRWMQSIKYLVAAGVTEIVEVGAGAKPAHEHRVLTRLVMDCLDMESWVTANGSLVRKAPSEPRSTNRGEVRDSKVVRPTADCDNVEFEIASLGSQLFRDRYHVRHSYVAGSMYRAVASPALVRRMAGAGLLSFLGSGGLSLAEIKDAIDTIRSDLPDGAPFGVNLLANYESPEQERATIDLLLREDIRTIEASAFIKPTPALALFRCSGLVQNSNGSVRSRHRIIAKVSRLEVAEAFMRPVPENLVAPLVASGVITPHQAELSKLVPLSEDICVEADSGGHTDGGVAILLFPEMLRLRDSIIAECGYSEPVLVGLAGGIGTPEAMASAFLMGADFVLTGSINQCTVESGASEVVKDLLQEMDIHDTDYAPAGDLFESGSKVQVLKRGVLFPTRANKLFSLYMHFDSIDELPPKVLRLLEGTYFKRTLDEVWQDVADRLRRLGRHDELAAIANHPKRRMATIFKWYFGFSTRVALDGISSERTNFQVHTGPALGAFNRWVAGSSLEPWQARHVDEIGLRLLAEASKIIAGRGLPTDAGSEYRMQPERSPIKLDIA